MFCLFYEKIIFLPGTGQIISWNICFQPTEVMRTHALLENKFKKNYFCKSSLSLSWTEPLITHLKIVLSLHIFYQCTVYKCGWVNRRWWIPLCNHPYTVYVYHTWYIYTFMYEYVLHPHYIVAHIPKHTHTHPSPFFSWPLSISSSFILVYIYTVYRYASLSLTRQE